MCVPFHLSPVVYSRSHDEDLLFVMSFIPTLSSLTSAFSSSSQHVAIITVIKLCFQSLLLVCHLIIPALNGSAAKFNLFALTNCLARFNLFYYFVSSSQPRISEGSFVYLVYHYGTTIFSSRIYIEPIRSMSTT